MWKFMGRYDIDQGESWHVFFLGNGRVAGGAAFAQDLTGGNNNISGSVSGGIEGRKMDFTIHWDQGPVGQYAGDIDDDGFVTHGSTWDLTAPESHSRWSSPSQLGCVDAITPPPSPDPIVVMPILPPS